MIYLDTNVIINSAVNNSNKQQALNLFLDTIENGDFFSSYLLVQETTFVFTKLNTPQNASDYYIQVLLDHLKGYDFSKQYKRGVELSKLVSFKSTNDCFHIAVAEEYCNQFITYDKDFEKIKPYTDLKINVLS